MSEFYKSCSTLLPLFALIVMSGLTTNSAAHAQTLHNNRASALPIYSAPGPYTYSHVGATGGTFVDRVASCQSNDGRNTTWVAFRPEANGTIDVTTAGSDFDTILLITDTLGNELACDDDGGPSTQSTISGFQVSAGTQYFLRISGWNGQEGNVAVSIQGVDLRHPFDRWTEAISTLSTNSRIFGWNLNTVGGPGLSCFVADANTAVWYAVTNIEFSRVAFEVESLSPNFNPMIHIYSGDPTQQANLIDCSDAPGGGTTDRVQTDIQPLQVIYVRVSGATSGPQGSYFLNTIDLLNTDAEEGGTPTSATLSAAYPNPFADQTTLDYVLPAAQDIHVAVYDVLGREVAVLHEGVQTAGEHEATFDAAGLPSGLYVVRLTVGDQTLARRVTIVR